MRVNRGYFQAIGAAVSASCLTACATPVESAAVLESETLEVAESASAPVLQDGNPRLIEDEVIYFVLPDRFENGDKSNDKAGSDGDRLVHGYDPTHKGFYHGGDLKGLTDRLDYIQGLGATAIWLTPIFENRWVQGPPGDESSGYHGYWITDFTNVDPHLGTKEDFKAFVDAAHAKDMKVYMDIITNHTADVINYRECHDHEWAGERSESCEYRYIGAYPWTTRGGPEGEPINEGFLGDDGVHWTEENFAKLTDPTWAYTPYLPEGMEDIKTPAWLNDPIYYTNRGETAFKDEDSVYGDFFGLDDLNTSHPRVIEGMVDIYKSWITDYRVDGFRIDTAKHVRDEFWQIFAPQILDHAKAEGIDHFHMFGEVFEAEQAPQNLAKFTTNAELPTVLDFAFQVTAREFVIEGEPGYRLNRLFSADVIYKDGAKTALQLPTFLGNHDIGRFSGLLKEHAPEMSDEELFARVRLAHGLMMFARGVPTIYYGDEQGFVSDGNDQLARENMFPSQVDVYNDNDLIGTDATTAVSNFDAQHPLYMAISEFAGIRHAEPTLRRGEQLTRLAHSEDGIFVFSRIDYASGEEIIIAVNAEKEAKALSVAVDGRATSFSSLLGACQPSVSAPGSYQLDVPALDLLVCKTEF